MPQSLVIREVIYINYKDIKSLIDYYSSLIDFASMAGVELPEARFKLDSCYYLLGWK